MNRIKSSLLLLIVSVVYSCHTNDVENNKNSINQEENTDHSSINADQSATKESSNEKLIINAHFKLNVKESDGVPNTDISVVVNGKITFIENIPGEAEIIEDDLDGLPANSIQACGAWYAGGGNYYYIIESDRNIEVFQGFLDESIPQNEGYHWKSVKMILL